LGNKMGDGGPMWMGQFEGFILWAGTHVWRDADAVCHVVNTGATLSLTPS